MTGHLLWFDPLSVICVPLLLGGLLPLSAAAGLLLAAHRGWISLTTRLTLAGLVVFGLGVALMAWSATTAVLDTGLAELQRRYLPTAVQAAAELPGVDDLTPRLALLRTANPAIRFVGVVRLDCSTDCLLGEDAESPAMQSTLATHPAAAWLDGHSGSAVLGDRLFAVTTAAVRDSLGGPMAVLVSGIDASSVAREAQRVVWRLLLTGWGLLGIVALGIRRLTRISVTQRVLQLIQRLRHPEVEGQGSRLHDELGELTRAVDTVIRESVERDRLQSARYRALFDNAPYGICQINRAGMILACNPAFARLAGADSATRLIGVGLRDYLLRDADLLALLSPQPLNAGTREPTEHEWLGGDGQVRRVRIATRATEDGIQLIMEDVTERRGLEAHLRQSQKMEALGQLTGGVAHDFNNLLTIILGTLPLLRDGIPGASRRALDDLSGIERAAERGAALIRKLLVFSRADDVRPRPTPVAPLVKGAGFLLQRSMPPTIRIVTAEPPVDAMITADPVAVEQMILNLANNARDAMPEGGELRVGAWRETIEPHAAGCLGLPEPGPYIAMAVSDNGRGIPEAIRDRVMDPFFTTKPFGTGTGLGLSMVYGLMQRHRGAVRITSEVDRGTTVSLLFPQAVVSPAAEGPGGLAPGSSPQPQRILLVEDDPAVLRLTSRTLERLGYAVDHAADGVEAMDRLHKFPRYAAVITDALMPRMSGPQLLRAARTAGYQQPFILVSGHAAEDLESIAAQDGRAWALRKPWVQMEFAQLLSMVLRTGADTAAH